MTQQNILNIFMLAPRGFCAGVERAVLTVEEALKKFGPPIYVKHQIVHNSNIIEDFTKRGVIFIDSIDSIPNNSILIFNAHGVTEEFENTVKSRNISYIDATCPLVKKVHREAIKHENNSNEIIVIGHKDHPEVIATISRIKKYPIIIQNTKEAVNFIPDVNKSYAFVTQTTLSIEYINEIISVLVEKIPNLTKSKNICYATQNRQNAIKKIILQIDALIIVGSKNSSNSNRLKEIGEQYNVKSYLVDNCSDIPFEQLHYFTSIAISAGASSPDYIVNNILESINKKFITNITYHETLKEDIKFVLPKIVYSKNAV